MRVAIPSFGFERRGALVAAFLAFFQRADPGDDQRLTVAALTCFRASAVEADLRERALVVLGMYRWGWISKRDASMPASAVSSARDQFQPR